MQRMEPSFFGGVTIGDTHELGSPIGARSVVSSLRSRCSSSSILGLMWNGDFTVCYCDWSHGFVNVEFVFAYFSVYKCPERC